MSEIHSAVLSFECRGRYGIFMSATHIKSVRPRNRVSRSLALLMEFLARITSSSSEQTPWKHLSMGNPTIDNRAWSLYRVWNSQLVVSLECINLSDLCRNPAGIDRNRAMQRLMLGSNYEAGLPLITTHRHVQSQAKAYYYSFCWLNNKILDELVWETSIESVDRPIVECCEKHILLPGKRQRRQFRDGLLWGDWSIPPNALYQTLVCFMSVSGSSSCFLGDSFDDFGEVKSIVPDSFNRDDWQVCNNLSVNIEPEG